MKATIIGKKEVHFVDEKTGQDIHIAKVMCIHKFPHDNDSVKYEGQAVSEVSVPVEYFNDILVGSDVLFDFDRNGKLLEMEQL